MRVYRYGWVKDRDALGIERTRFDICMAPELAVELCGNGCSCVIDERVALATVRAPLEAHRRLQARFQRVGPLDP